MIVWLWELYALYICVHLHAGLSVFGAELTCTAVSAIFIV